MKRRLRIAVFTWGRFHVFYLARELDALGHDVRFYSVVPPWRTRKFGLRGPCNRWLLPYLAPTFVAGQAATRLGHIDWAEWKQTLALDRTGVRHVEPCDVFIGMSGMCNRVAEAVRRKYGAKVWIERASEHILTQKQRLAVIPGARQVPDWVIPRELTDYTLADTLVVPSLHVQASFEAHHYPLEKVYRSLFGVDLGMFAPTPSPPLAPPTILMTGAWSLQKGCDVLVEAWRRLPGTRLLHVGPIVDCPLPAEPGFVHHDKVDQSRLREFYAQAHVFALASRQEGLSVVLLQALSCGLRLVCCARTGGADLKPFVTDPAEIRVVPPDEPAAFTEGLRQALADSARDRGLRERLLGDAREELSWAGYARRYSRALEERV